MNERAKKAILLSLLFGGLIILYNSFPEHSSIILFSVLFGLTLSRTYGGES